MPGGDLSPALELAVRLLAEGQAIPASLCNAKPLSVGDIKRVRLGHGEVSAEGGLISVTRSGVCRCIAYDVRGQLVTTQTTAMPCQVTGGTHAKIGALVSGSNGVPHK